MTYDSNKTQHDKTQSTPNAGVTGNKSGTGSSIPKSGYDNTFGKTTGSTQPLPKDRKK